MKNFKITTAYAAFAMVENAAYAEVEISCWHAMGGALGETANQIATDFNASQNDYKITPVFKGTYEETLTTVIGAKDTTVPVQGLLVENGVAFDINDYISGVRYFYADAAGK